MKMAWYVGLHKGIGPTGEPGPAVDRIVVCHRSMLIETARDVWRQLGEALNEADSAETRRRNASEDGTP